LKVDDVKSGANIKSSRICKLLKDNLAIEFFCPLFTHN
jgi:hypothetical protein